MGDQEVAVFLRDDDSIFFEETDEIQSRDAMLMLIFSRPNLLGRWAEVVEDVEKNEVFVAGQHFLVEINLSFTEGFAAEELCQLLKGFFAYVH